MLRMCFRSEVVGRGLITMLQKGENGSIWICEANQCVEVEIPLRKTWRKI